MKIVFNSFDLLEWFGFGLIGVDLLFDDCIYCEMNKVIMVVKKVCGN